MEVSSGVVNELIDSPSREIDWHAYASQYDLLAANNPSYHENIQILRSLLEGFALPPDAHVCDIGAGTGNYICALAQDLPGAQFVHLDSDASMNEVARRKYEQASIRNVEVHCCSAVEACYPQRSFDLVICINALYAIHHRDDLLRKIRGWLKPGGVFFVIDFGRRTKMMDWAAYIFGHILREKGVRACFRFLSAGFEAIRQNRRGSQGQVEGVYWLHSTEEFARELEGAGFSVDHLRTCYRGYCDLAVCRLA